MITWKSMRRQYILLSITLLLMIVLAVLLIAKHKQENGKLMIADFNNEGVCVALMPSCGYCPGTEMQGDCYVTQAEFDEYKKQYSGLKTK